MTDLLYTDVEESLRAGRTALSLFDPAASPPSLLRAGDRVLEIGAGTGGTTAKLLPMLRGLPEPA